MIFSLCLDFINLCDFKLHLHVAVVLKSIKRDYDYDDDDDDDNGICQVYPVNWLVDQMRKT